MRLSSRETARVFGALSDVTRVEIVRLVAKAPRNVTQLTSLVGVSQPKVSRHLRILRDAGLVRDVRRGKWVWYELAASPKDRAGSEAVSAISELFSATGSREELASLGEKLSGEDTAPFAGSTVSGEVSPRIASRHATPPRVASRGSVARPHGRLRHGVSGAASSRTAGAQAPGSRRSGGRKVGPRSAAQRAANRKSTPGATHKAPEARPAPPGTVPPRKTKRRQPTPHDEAGSGKKELEDFLL
ncbi:MAG: metalloregulator ArsR/SmtB family transcription factor [Candidatus Eiseniibacteriota bacterium]|nr:MAG: metalloregulator ArsR/SmtB family transcription factor [Candidatus Eisenbacteria bacterium]